MHSNPARTRAIVYSKFLNKLNDLIASGNIGVDPEESRWRACEAISWPVGSRPITVPEGDPRLSQWPILAAKAGEWMVDAKRIAVAGYRQVLEDGQDVCDSESDAEYSDHGEVHEGMYTDEATLGSARLTTQQSNAPRAKGRASGQVTALGKG
jgi:hypothetical protein